MRILVTGAAGMLGSAICPAFERAGYQVLKTDIRIPDPSIHTLDVRNLDDVKNTLTEQRPDIILHLAAETDVDLCERDSLHAFKTNLEGTKNVAHACIESSALLVYISTAGVFDGTKTLPYVETDIPNPIMVYGHSKLAGEEFISSTASSYYIIRAGWMVGGQERDKKFVSKILEQVYSGVKKIYAVNDKFGTPTYTVDFAQNLLTLIRAEHFGLYHMGCKGTGSRFNVAQHILTYLGREDIELVPVPSSFFNSSYPAPRPRSEMLENQALDRLGLNQMRDWRTALSDYLSRSSVIGKVSLR